LTDDEALADIAVIYSSVFVHEMTHHRQSLWGRSRFPKKIAGSDQVFAYGYNQAWETEAFKAAAAFLKQKRAADPSFAAREARLRRIPLIDRYFAEEENAKDLAEMPRFRQYYTAVPTLSRSARQIIALGIENDEKNARSAKLIDVELARRSRLARLERLALEKNGIAFEALRGGANLKKTSTSGLRRLRDELRGQAQIMLKAANDLIERTRTELEKL